MTTEPTIPRSLDGFTSVDGFLSSEGKREAFEAIAIKEVLAWRIENAMKGRKVSGRRLAERMHTSRSQVGRGCSTRPTEM